MFNINRWFAHRYLRCATKEFVPSDEQILRQLNQRVDRKRYRYHKIVDLQGYIIPVLRHTLKADFYSIDLIHISERGHVTELESATVVEDQLREFLPPEILKQCFNEEKVEYDVEDNVAHGAD